MLARYLTLSVLLAAPALAQTTERVTVTSAGAQLNGPSAWISLSGDGRFVAFVSPDATIVPNDGNGVSDVFVRDRLTGVTVRASVRADGVEADGTCHDPHLSDDGRFVAFSSFATNLAPSDTNGAQTDIFVKDLVTGALEHASVSSAGAGGNGISAYLDLSGDGRSVTFYSYATNLVAGDTNGAQDVFLHDRQSGSTERVSVDSAGVQMPAGGLLSTISDDGLRVAFEGWDGAGGPVIWLRDRQLGQTTLASAFQGNIIVARMPVLSGDGLTLAFSALSDGVTPDDVPFKDEVFALDLLSGAVTRVSAPAPGGEDGDSFASSLSADGRFVAFLTQSALDPSDPNGDFDVYVRDRALATTSLGSVGDSGQLAAGRSSMGSLSADGRLLAFWSDAANLVTGDTNGVGDGFVRDPCGAAAFATYGAGFPGSGGVVPTLVPTATPALGASLGLVQSNPSGQPTLATLLIGLEPAAAPTPFGGTLLVLPAVAAPWPLAATGAVLPVTVPTDPALCGVSVRLQTIVPDPGAAAGFAFTAGLELRPGG